MLIFFTKIIFRKECVFIAVLFYIFVLSPFLTSAQSKNELNGIIVDIEENSPVENANIIVTGENIFTTSKDDGSFKLIFEEKEKYQIKITHIAYKEELLTVDLRNLGKESMIVYLVPRSIETSPVIISGQNIVSKFDALYEASNVLKGKELQKELESTLAATLKNETGLAIRSMGPAPARPVIRGLGGDRVMITEDGNKTTDLSATSPDHAVTIEPFGVDRIEVIRGPKVLLKTPTTIGGVVNVVRKEIPEQIHDKIYGTAGAYGETVNDGYLGSMMMELPFAPFNFRFEGSRRHTINLSTPAGDLDNSYSRNYTWSAGGSYFPNFGFAGISYRDYNLNYGIPGGFIGAHPNGVDIEMFRRQFNLKTKINLNSKTFENIQAHFSNVLYRHKEFEEGGLIGSEFKVRSYQGYVNLNYRGFGLPSQGTFGISAEYRDFDIGGFVFTPQSKSLNISSYVYESFNTGKFSFEFGARYNYDRISPDNENNEADIGYIREREYHTYSLSFSTLYSLTDIVHFGININKSSRVPTIEELYSEGPHLAAYSYEVGNPDLEDERGWGAEFFVYHKFEGLYFHLNAFRNDLNYYIIPRNTGEINYQTFLPVYKTFGVPALFCGFEGQIRWKLDDHFQFNFTASYTRGKFKDEDTPLPQIPPLKGNIEISYNTDEWSAGIGSELAADQNNVDEFEKSTAGYAVFNSFFQYSLPAGSLLHNFTFNVDNIFDTEYRNHLSRIKSVLPEAGRNFRLTYKLYFHL